MKKIKRQIIRYLSMSVTGIAAAVFSFFAPAPVPAVIPVKRNNKNQSGYMMLILLLLTIAVTALFASVTFYYAKRADLNRYFVFGQQVARYARAADSYTQRDDIQDIFIANPAGNLPVNNNDLENTQTINRNFRPVKLNTATIDINRMVAIRAPVNMPDNLRAPSVYIYVDLTAVSPGQTITSAQLEAIKAGASSEGALIGFPQNPQIIGNTSTKSIVIPDTNRSGCADASGTVNSGTNGAFVRWGAGDYDCMSATEIDTVFGLNTSANMDYFDFIVPAWVAAQYKTDTRAVFRLPRPGIPAGQSMETGIQMGGNNIGGTNPVSGLASNIGNLTNATMTAADASGNPIPGVSANYVVGGGLKAPEAKITGHTHMYADMTAVDETTPTGTASVSSIKGNATLKGDVTVFAQRDASGKAPLKTKVLAADTKPYSPSPGPRKGTLQAPVIAGPGTVMTTLPPAEYVGNMVIESTNGVSTDKLKIENSDILVKTQINIGNGVVRGDLKASNPKTSSGSPAVFGFNNLNVRKQISPAANVTGSVGARSVTVGNDTRKNAGTLSNLNITGSNLDIIRKTAPSATLSAFEVQSYDVVPPGTKKGGNLTIGNAGGTTKASNKCFGACPDNAPVPDPDPLN